MSERLPRLDMADQERRNLVVEESARNTTGTVRNVQATWNTLLRAFLEVALEVRCAILMRVYLNFSLV